MNSSILSFNKPASDWNEAFPVGNGRMGAMVFGGIATELLQLNEDSVWYGGPRDRINPSAIEKLPLIRQAIDEGRIKDAEDMCALALSGMPDTQSHLRHFVTSTFFSIMRTEKQLIIHANSILRMQRSALSTKRMMLLTAEA